MTHDELAGFPEAVAHDKVPVLVDEGQVVVESNEIIRTLDRKFPERPIFSELKSAEQARWMNYADEELVQILPANIYRNFFEALGSFRYITKVGKFPRWKRYTLALGGAVAMTIVARKGMKKRGITDPRQALWTVLEKWEEGLSSKKFMGGEAPDVSDLVCYGVLSSVREMKVWPFISRQKKLLDWFERVRSEIPQQ